MGRGPGRQVALVAAAWLGVVVGVGGLTFLAIDQAERDLGLVLPDSSGSAVRRDSPPSDPSGDGTTSPGATTTSGTTPGASASGAPGSSASAASGGGSSGGSSLGDGGSGAAGGGGNGGDGGDGGGVPSGGATTPRTPPTSPRTPPDGPEGPDPTGTPSPPPTGTTPTDRTASFSTPGGTVVASCWGTAFTLLTVTPSDGWRFEQEAGPLRAQVTFRRPGAHTVELGLSCRDGVPVATDG